MAALKEYELSQEYAVKRYLQVCNKCLSALIQLVLGDLSAADCTKITSPITMDVHSCDVVDILIAQKNKGPNTFCMVETNAPWVRTTYPWCECEDMQFLLQMLFYEWVGKSGCLIIAPSILHLGGAPAGLAGTGKSETTRISHARTPFHVTCSIALIK